MKEFVRRLLGLLGLPFVIAYLFGGPITYILAVVDTWNTNLSVPMKIVVNLTLDLWLVPFWPAVWMIWGVLHAMGKQTPLILLFG